MTLVDRAAKRMSIGEQFFFFLVGLHGGALNLGLHVISLPILFLGLAAHSVAAVTLALVLDVVGHAYNYFVRYDEEMRRKSVQVLPLQLGFSVIFLLALFASFGWF